MIIILAELFFSTNGIKHRQNTLFSCQYMFISGKVVSCI